MPAQRILAVVKPAEWAFLEDYFSDTQSRLVPAEPKELLNPIHSIPDFLFLDLSLAPKESRESLVSLSRAKKTRFFFLGASEDSIFSLQDFPEAARLTRPIEPAQFEQMLLRPAEFPPEVRVLVVDDEYEICAGMKEYLESGRCTPGFRVEHALNGLEAFHKMEQFHPDVTIMDLKMPVKSGHDFYREAQKRYPGFRAIVLTSSVGPDEIEEIRKSGTPPVVEKGSRRSSFPELVSLVKKTWIFS